MNNKTSTQTPYFTEEKLKELISQWDEPEFLTEIRRQALSTFQSLPWPHTKMEEWRRTPISQYDFEAFSPVEKVEEKGEESSYLGEVAGFIKFTNSQISTQHLGDEWAEKGVIFSSLREAAKDHPQIVKKYLNQIVPAETGKFQALNQSFWTHGAFLYVPKFTTVANPFHVVFDNRGEEKTSQNHLLVVLEPGARATLLDEHTSSDESRIFQNGLTEIKLEDESRLEYLHLQQSSLKTLYFWNGWARLERDAYLHSLASHFGSSLVKTKFGATLQGKGSEAKMDGVWFASENQHFDQRTVQHHASPYTTSNLLYRGALRDKAYTVYQGKIQVDEKAVKTNAYQTNNNLLLSDQSRADTIPGLEIKADDLKCSHGATVGKISKEELFYLKCRGISHLDARNLIVLGFLEQVMGQAPQALKRNLYEAICHKLEIPYANAEEVLMLGDLEE